MNKQHKHRGPNSHCTIFIHRLILFLKVNVRPSQGGESPREVISDNGNILITGMTPGKDYTVSITAVVDDEEQGSPIVKKVVTSKSL